jgi:hypothetical protein
MQAALHDTDTVLATADAHAEAVMLAGTDHADAFLFGTKQTVESRYEQMFGRWYVNAGARSSQLVDARTAGIDSAYAHPLDLVAAHTSGSQLAADAVLAELARMDFLHSDIGRSLDQMVHDARPQHAMAIGAFRTMTPEAYPGHPEWDAYVGSWLGLYTEVAIVRATGKVDHTLVEID